MGLPSRPRLGRRGQVSTGRSGGGTTAGGAGGTSATVSVVGGAAPAGPGAVGVATAALLALLAGGDVNGSKLVCWSEGLGGRWGDVAHGVCCPTGYILRI